MAKRTIRAIKCPPCGSTLEVIVTKKSKSGKKALYLFCQNCWYQWFLRGRMAQGRVLEQSFSVQIDVADEFSQGLDR